MIVDWRPLERIVTRDSTRIGGANFTFPVEYLLEEVSEGTRFTQRSGVSEAPAVAKAILKRLLLGRLTAQFQRDIDAFGDAIQQTHETRAVTAEVGS